MPITRRTLIRQLLYVSAGAALVPACMEDRSKASIILNNIAINGEQEKLLAEIAETMIPKTQTPGARDISAHLFALKMIDDCRSPEEQKAFMDGLMDFEKGSGKGFLEMNAADRTKALLALERDKKTDNAEQAFYRDMKRLTIQAYTGSEFFLTKVQVYELVPGRYHGCVQA